LTIAEPHKSIIELKQPINKRDSASRWTAVSEFAIDLVVVLGLLRHGDNLSNVGKIRREDHSPATPNLMFLLIQHISLDKRLPLC
jgi:hypothetical protein